MRIWECGKSGKEEGADAGSWITEEINTFTIHLGIFTSDNLLAKLRKLAGTPGQFYISFSFFSIYAPRGICGVPNKRMRDFTKGFYGNS